MKEIRWHPEAEDELYRSVEFYEDKAGGLGLEFLDHVEQSLGIVQEYPEVGPEFTSGIRRWLVRRFPFEVVYSVQTDVIYVLALKHQHQEPGYWKSRDS